MTSLLRLLGWESAADRGGHSAADTDSVRRIVAALDELEPERARWLAAFAYLLSRVASADLRISAEETAAMEAIVAERGQLPEAQAVLVVEIAKTQCRLFGATENFLVTREFDRIASRAEKLALLDCLFAISAVEAGVTVAEDNEIKRIANELKLEHQDFIAARSRVREHVVFLRRPPA